MIRRLIPVALLTIAAAPLAAQRSDFHWDKAVAAGGEVSIHNINGDIKVVPSTTGRVDVTGFKRGTGSSLDHLKVDVRESGRGVSICVIRDDADDECDENGMHSHGRYNRDWDRAHMDLEIAVPANLRVAPSTVSGDISITGAQGDLNVSSVSGDIRLDHVKPSAMHITTVSGDVEAQVDQFAGTGDLNFHSVSGDVTLTLPRDFAADLTMGSVSGDIDSDFPITLGGRSRMSRRNVNARIGAGGRRLDVSTVSGDLRLRSAR